MIFSFDAIWVVGVYGRVFSINDSLSLFATKCLAVTGVGFFAAILLGAAEVSTNSPAGGQTWNWHVQNTDIVQGYPAFPAKYTNPGFNSLPPAARRAKRFRWI